MTTTVEHTPGPWKAETHCVWGPNDHYVAATRTGLDEDTSKANAHLIAAAPELLAACREAINILTLDRTPRTLQENAQVRLDAKRTLRAAINKATLGA